MTQNPSQRITHKHVGLQAKSNDIRTRYDPTDSHYYWNTVTQTNVLFKTEQIRIE